MKANKHITTYTNVYINIQDITLLSEEEYIQLIKNIKPINIGWWLSSPSERYNNKIGFVSSNGSVYYGLVYGIDIWVRPSLVVQSKNLSCNDSFDLFGYAWTMISDTIALCDDVIGKHIFDRRTNDYNESLIKLFLQNWFSCMRFLFDKD